MTDQARTPTADHRRPFPVPRRAGSSHAGGRKLLNHLCAQDIFVPLVGQHYAAVSPSSKKCRCFALISLPELLLGLVLSPLSAAGPREMCCSLLLLSRGGHRGHSLHSPASIPAHAAPGPEIMNSEDSLVGKGGGDAVGAVQACQWLSSENNKTQRGTGGLPSCWLPLTSCLNMWC